MPRISSISDKKGEREVALALAPEDGAVSSSSKGRGLGSGFACRPCRTPGGLPQVAKDQETLRNAGRSKENAQTVNFSLAGPDGRVYMTVLRREDLKRNAASKTKFWDTAAGLSLRD